MPHQWVQLVGASSFSQNVVISSISDQHTRLGCEFNPQSKGLRKATNRCFSLPFPLSDENKINMKT